MLEPFVKKKKKYYTENWDCKNHLVKHTHTHTKKKIYILCVKMYKFQERIIQPIQGCFEKIRTICHTYPESLRRAFLKIPKDFQNVQIWKVTSIYKCSTSSHNYHYSCITLQKLLFLMIKKIFIKIYIFIQIFFLHLIV